MQIQPSPCPHCEKIIGAVNIANDENRAPKENDITMCMECGEFMLFGPYLTLKKCDLTPDQMADKLGLLVYGTLLIIQKRIQGKG